MNEEFVSNVVKTIAELGRASTCVCLPGMVQGLSSKLQVSKIAAHLHKASPRFTRLNSRFPEISMPENGANVLCQDYRVSEALATRPLSHKPKTLIYLENQMDWKHSGSVGVAEVDGAGQLASTVSSQTLNLAPCWGHY